MTKLDLTKGVHNRMEPVRWHQLSCHSCHRTVPLESSALPIRSPQRCGRTCKGFMGRTGRAFVGFSSLAASGKQGQQTGRQRRGCARLRGAQLVASQGRTKAEQQGELVATPNTAQHSKAHAQHAQRSGLT